MQNNIDPDLPDELQDAAYADAEQKAEQLKDLSLLLAKKREDAVSGRASSGIEEIWTEDEEYYEGIDDANRADSRVMKPSSASGGLMRSRTASVTRSTVFLRLTTQYVDSAAARVSDMLLPTDDSIFEIKPQADPEVMDDKENTELMQVDGQQVMRPAVEGEQGASVGPNGKPGVPATHADHADAVMTKATESAKRAERQISTWLDECSFYAEKRKAIHDRAKLGVSVMKGPFPVKNKSTKVERKNGVASLVIREETNPASKRIDPWNFYPDPACGENIHNGNFCFEKDFLTEKQLRALIGVPGYLEGEIKECIKEGPQKAYAESRTKKGSDRDLYQVWYYCGEIKISDLKVANYQFSGEEKGKDDDESLPAVMTMVNDRVIKAALNILDSGEFPYDVCPWQVRTASWAGIGVARQVREAQGGLNAGVRNMMDNAALSGGPILIINRALIKPVDGSWILNPRKVFETTDEADGSTDVTKAIIAINIPSAQKDLMEIINFFGKMAEQTTGLPMLLQGQTGNAPDTLGGQLLANNNASTVLRRIARLDDDNSTEPHIRRYYEYLLIHGDDDSAKDNFEVHARGSSALVERDIQNHAVLGILQYAANPAFGIDPYKATTEALKAQRLDPKRFQIPEEDFEKLRQAPPQPAPVVQAAQIREQGAVKRLEMELQAEHAGQQQGAPDTGLQIANIRHQTEIDKATMNRDTDMQELQFKAGDAERQRQHELQMMQFQYQMKLMEFSQMRQQTLDETKKELADTSMRLQTQKELSQQSIAADLHKHHSPQVVTPPTEPVGTAAPGRAFEQ